MLRFTAKFILMIFCLTTVMASFPVDSDAKSRGGFSSSRSSWGSSSKSSWGSSSKSSSSVFGKRSGGGLYGSTKSKPANNGYSKPSPKPTKTAANYSKPAAKPNTKPANSGYSKPKTTDKKPATSGYSKSGAQKQTAKAQAQPKTFQGGSKADQKVTAAAKKEKSKKSLADYKASKQKFKKPVTAKADPKKYAKDPVYSKVRNRNVNYNTYYYDRDRYYSSWNRPNYVYYGSPSYGMYDAMFMWMMLDSINDRNYSRMYYHNSSDPGFQQWRREANELAKDNAELKAKLAKLDAEVGKINEPKEAGFVPDNIPVEMALAPEFVMPATPVMTMATGNEALVYHFTGQTFDTAVEGKIDVQLQPTSGSFQNLKLLEAGEVDAIMAQSNMIKLYEKQNPNSRLISEQFAVYPEPLQLIVNGKSDIDSISDLDDDHIIIPGPRGSGTDKTWDDLVSMDSDYKEVQKMNMSYDEALKRVKSNPNVVMLVVAGLNSSFMNKVEQQAAGGALKLAPVDDFGFFDLDDVADKNGNPVYSTVEIPADTYPNLQAGRFYGTNSVETLSVDAIFLLSTKWVQRNGMDKADVVAAGLLDTQTKVLKRVGVLD